MLLDSHIDRRVAVHSTLGMPRWHKRIIYYIYKIRYLQLVSKRIARLPKSSARILLSNPYFNEYEVYEIR
jgi:hypothetical protein